MQHDLPRLLLGTTVALSFMVMVAYVVTRVCRTAPNRVAVSLTALASVCGALPAILYALH